MLVFESHAKAGTVRKLALFSVTLPFNKVCVQSEAFKSPCTIRMKDAVRVQSQCVDINDKSFCTCDGTCQCRLVTCSTERFLLFFKCSVRETKALPGTSSGKARSM